MDFDTFLQESIFLKVFFFSHMNNEDKVMNHCDHACVFLVIFKCFSP